MRPDGFKWSGSEKKIAQRAYEAAWDAAMPGIIAEFKSQAAAVATPEEMWQIEDYLRRKRREIEELFDYRYSQLLFVFARLICLGHLDEGQLAGLSVEKLEEIRHLVARISER